jgi:hypothetical protein
VNHRKEFSGGGGSSGPDVEDRKPRSEEEMRKEAEFLRAEMEQDRFQQQTDQDEEGWPIKES